MVGEVDDLKEDYKSTIDLLGSEMRHELRDLRGMFMGEVTKLSGRRDLRYLPNL